MLFHRDLPKKLAQPYDVDHMPCGVDDRHDYPFLYIVSPKKLDRNVCVKSCPTNETETLDCFVNSVVTSCKTNFSPTDIEK